jgi:pyruvate/2-oxoglutarate dehydrogenase complex dihydrolipoamide acyltransferase (E2) component
MAQWARFGRLPVEFILYIPSGVVGVARRLCADHGIGVTEIWTYHTIGDQVRFAQVHRAPLAEKLAAARAAAAEARRASAKDAEPRKTPATKAKTTPKPAAKAAAKRAAAKPARPAARRAASKKR